MVLTLPTNLATHITEEATSLAQCIEIVRRDGNAFRFTDHDVDIVFNGDTYTAKGGFDSTALDSSAGLAVDNMEIEAILDDSSITEEDLKLGRFNAAKVTIFLVNYEDTASGERVILKSGTLGDIKVRDSDIYSAEIRSLAETLQNRVGRLYLPHCNAKRLGDVRCKVSLTGRSFNLTVSASSGRQVFEHDTSVLPAEYFRNGVLTWTGGDNNGFEFEVKQYVLLNGGAQGQFTLQVPTGKLIQVGDTFTAFQGCDRLLATCRDVFNNVDNFRGFPHLPGLDEMLKVGT